MKCPVFLDDVNYRVTSPFGYRTHPVTEQQQSFHGGIDIVSSQSNTQQNRRLLQPYYSNQKDVKGYSEKLVAGGNYVSIMTRPHGDVISTWHTVPVPNLQVGDYVRTTA